MFSLFVFFALFFICSNQISAAPFALLSAGYRGYKVAKKGYKAGKKAYKTGKKAYKTGKKAYKTGKKFAKKANSAYKKQRKTLKKYGKQINTLKNKGNKLRQTAEENFGARGSGGPQEGSSGGGNGRGPQLASELRGIADQVENL